MTKFLISILIACTLVNCTKKQDTPSLQTDDTFFNGFIGRDFFDVKNEFREDKAIKTIQESPSYNFIFSYTFDNRPNETQVHSTVLSVNIADPKEGEKYLISTEISEKNVSQDGITCNQKTLNIDEVQSNLYVPMGAMKPVHVLVDKVDIDSFDKSKIVTGQIKGFLFNKLNLQDSIEINAEFKTKLYK